MEKLPDSQWTG